MYLTRILWEGELIGPPHESSDEEQAYGKHEEACSWAECHTDGEALTVQTYRESDDMVLAETRVENGVQSHAVGSW